MTILGKSIWSYSKTLPSPLLPHWGWKIHVSASPSSFESLLTLLEDFEKIEGFHYKYANCNDSLLRLNTGEFGDSQIGKAVTIYPKSLKQLRRIYRRLKNLRNDAAPKVPSDIYFDIDDIISFRFGQLSHRPDKYINNSVGYDDTRLFGESPSWWPVLRMNKKVAKIHPMYQKISTFIHQGRRFDVERTFGRPGKPILEVFDGRHRMFGKLRFKGTSSVPNSRNEWNICQALKGTGSAPHPKVLVQKKWYSIEFFNQITGDSFDKFPAEIGKHYLNKMAIELNRLHKYGYAHLDFKLANILLDIDTNDIQMIDFELTSPLGTKLNHQAGTPGYRAPELTSFPRVSGALDVYAFGSVVAHLCLDRDPWHLRESAKPLYEECLDKGFYRCGKLIKLCQEKDPLKRPSMETILKGDLLNNLFQRSERREESQYAKNLPK